MIVTVRNPAHKMGMGRSEYTYEGELVATPKWVDYDAIALTTGERKFPFRIIPKENIISMDGSSYKFEAKPVDRVFIVDGSKGNQYTVTIGTKYKNCTCPAFQFRRSCKHIAVAA